MEGILGCIRLDTFDELLEHFLLPPCKHLHIIVQLSHDSEYPCYLFIFYILLIIAPYILLMFHSSSFPLPLCMAFLHCLYFAMFSALLIVNRWFAIIIPCSSFEDACRSLLRISGLLWTKPSLSTTTTTILMSVQVITYLNHY
jgi:hypothetical protein